MSGKGERQTNHVDFCARVIFEKTSLEFGAFNVWKYLPAFNFNAFDLTEEPPKRLPRALSKTL